MNKIIFLVIILILILPSAILPKESNNSEKCKLYLKSKMSNPVNIVILGDGFTSTDITSGFYDRKIAEFMDKYFYVAPYGQFIDYFNVYIVYAVSRDKGADDAPGKDVKNTVFNCTFGGSGIQRLLIVQDNEALDRYTAYATDNPHNIIVIVNDERYGGSGGSITVASLNSSVFGLVLHEMGHSFGNLADEYEDEETASYYSIDGAKSAYNVDLVKDPKKIKWSKFIGLTGYDMVGIYEGGYYRSKGVYRPQKECMMRSLGSPYCHICRELITKNIFKIINQSYNFNEFIMHDPTGKNEPLLVYSPVNSKGQKILPYMFSGSKNNSTENVNDKTENGKSKLSKNSYNNTKQNEDIQSDEIYSYYNGYFINLGNKKWEEKTKTSDVYKFKEYDRDNDYIYINDTSRNISIALPIGHRDLYIWENNKWKLLYQVDKIDYIPEK